MSVQVMKPQDGVTVIGLVKGEERYIVLYDDSRRVDALRTLGRWACDKQLSFTFYDAARMALKVTK